MAARKADSALQQDARSRLESAREKVRVNVNESVKKTRKAIQERPLTAVGVAAGASVVVGLVAGVALTKKTNAKKKRDDNGEI